MKKLFLVFAILAMATQALAWNLNFLGSNDKQKKQRYTTTQTQPNDPVPVPEPATLILLGSGLVALVAYKVKK